MDQTLFKREVVHEFLKKGFLVSPTIIETINEERYKLYSDIISKKDVKDLLVLNEDVLDIIANTKQNISWYEIERALVQYEKGKNVDLYPKFLSHLKEAESEEGSRVKIILSYDIESKKRDINDFVKYFNVRYQTLQKILFNRQEIKNTISITRLYGKKDKDNVSVIGLVKDKYKSKSGHIILTLEDPTGTINVIVSKHKPELYKEAESIVLDEVIGVSGMSGDRTIFVNNIVWPDIPEQELKKSKDDAYAIFLSDFHIGSNKFLEKEFKRFLKWINADLGNEEQTNIAKKVKYIFIIGDLVDGCGIYPNQEEELEIKDIYEQYKFCAELLEQIPSHMNLIIAPGNHDAMRIAEPQPPLYKDFAGPLYKLPNVIMVSNPAMVNIHSSKDFPGFDVLLYHGYSFDYFVANVDYIRNNGAYDRADLIMKFLLKRRHLAPTHTSTLYIPNQEEDPLVINKVPDIFATGHLHKAVGANYKNITLICGSCWQSKTTFQEKIGHNPEPCRVPIINLQNRAIKILKFN